MNKMDVTSTSLLTLGSIFAGIGSEQISTNIYAGIILLVLAGITFFVREYFKID